MVSDVRRHLAGNHPLTEARSKASPASVQLTAPSKSDREAPGIEVVGG
jgi:hypothetical protein